jgi:hypothetical protein
MKSEYRPVPWRRFFESGFETSPYETSDLPTGPRRVLLEASAWHRNQPAVTCFFRDLDSEQRYRISVFRTSKSGLYGPEGFDFSAVPPGTTLAIEILQNQTGTYRILAAAAEPAASPNHPELP